MKSNLIIQKRLRVCAYARVSTEKEEQLNSYNSQLKYYEEKIKSNSDWQYVGIYADEGITGTLDYKRDGFMNMIKDATNNKFDMIITKSISRFGRNTVDTLKYVRLLKEKGIAIYFEEEKKEENQSKDETTKKEETNAEAQKTEVKEETKKEESNDSNNKQTEVKTEQVSSKPANKDFLFVDGYTMENVTQAAQDYLKSSGHAGECTPIKDNECLWTVLKKDLEELVETEKKRDVVGEELEKYHIIENNIELTDNTKEIEVDLEIEKEVGDE